MQLSVYRGVKKVWSEELEEYTWFVSIIVFIMVIVESHHLSQHKMRRSMKKE